MFVTEMKRFACAKPFSRDLACESRKFQARLTRYENIQNLNTASLKIKILIKFYSLKPFCTGQKICNQWKFTTVL